MMQFQQHKKSLFWWFKRTANKDDPKLQGPCNADFSPTPLTKSITQIPVVLESPTDWPECSIRWSSSYDVYICHSEKDSKYALELLSYLEAQPEKLRCFLPMRDMEVGSPIPYEICHGLGSSHCWIMLLTSDFLSDSWCKYQMHQALAESPVSEGRFIPVMINLQISQYPPELKYMFSIRSASFDSSIFANVKKSILWYLKSLQIENSDVSERQRASNNNKHGISSESQQSFRSTQDSSCGDIQKMGYMPMASQCDVHDKIPEFCSNTLLMSIDSEEHCRNTKGITYGAELPKTDIKEKNYVSENTSRGLQEVVCETQDANRNLQ